MPPGGAEQACQEYLAGVLRGLGWETRLYRPDEVPGATEHPLWWPGRDYGSRPNLGARRKGAGGGRSLVLSGHADTVPRGTQPWTRDAFGGEVDGNRLYGRGSNDMKAGLAINLFVAEAIGRLGLEPAGDLIFESVVDEEFGGVNGTVAGRLAGYNGDAAVIAEPSFLRICAAQRGGQIAHIKFSARGGILGDATSGVGTVEQLTKFLAAVPAFVGNISALFHVEYGLTPTAVAQGLAVGLLVSVLFSLVPLLDVRLVKPSLLLRRDLPAPARFDWLKWTVTALVAGASSQPEPWPS
jgi:acetylornithine deacetylase